MTQACRSSWTAARSSTRGFRRPTHDRAEHRGSDRPSCFKNLTEFIPRAAAPVIKVADVAYVPFARRDLRRAERYFLDFGLRLSVRTDNAIYLRGVLPQHHYVIVERAERDAFAALGLRATSPADLRALAAAHATRWPADEPGGGERVRLQDRPALPWRWCMAWSSFPGCIPCAARNQPSRREAPP